ncbi:MAG: ABC transporter permease subunit [Coriobacteriales bacterium]|nr:ABC transporter permease subunit [Coriobacteriales bacterium]
MATLREVVFLLLPVAGILIALGLHLALPDVYPPQYEPSAYSLTLFVCLLIYLVFMIFACFFPKLRAVMLHLSGLLLVLFLLLEALDIGTLKTGILRLPFIPSPDKTLSTFTTHTAELGKSLLASLQLLLTGLAIGSVTGFISGLLMGWSRLCSYWLSPVLKIIGPVPGAAWMPIAVAFMPTSHAAGLFLIALAMWFPFTLMLSSSIRDTDKRLIEAARVLGASDAYLLLHVALPSSLPAIFTGMFMGLSNSFSALMAAEMLGVKAGLGWYITWAQGWGEYGRVYSTVGVFIIIFFTLITLLFKVRDHVLKWQKGLIRW